MNRSGFFLANFHSPPAPSPTAPQNPAPKSSPNSTIATQYILNDTSLAALVLSDGDRHLFFQDNNGLIRRVIRSASENQWAIDPSRNLSSSPKSNTPLAATAYSDTEIFNEYNGLLDLVIVNLGNPFSSRTS